MEVLFVAIVVFFWHKNKRTTKENIGTRRKKENKKIYKKKMNKLIKLKEII